MAVIGDVIPCKTTGLIWFLLRRLKIVDGWIGVKFSTLHNAFAFPMIVASVPCIKQVVAPSSCLFFFGARWYCFVASRRASRWRFFTSRLLLSLLPLRRPPAVLSSSSPVVEAPIVVPVVPAAVSLLPPPVVSNVNAESVEVLDPPPLWLLAVAATSSSGGHAASF